MSTQSQSISNKGLGSYVRLVRHNRNFRFLWFGQIVSLLGDWFNLIAAAALIASLTESGFAVSGLFIVRFLAPFIVSPVAGVFADRYNRKYLLIGADIGRAVVVLGFLLVRDVSHIWLLYALSALQMGLSGFFFPARNAILPDIVERKDLGAANALSAATWSVMLGLGAALGGLAAGQFGVYPAFVLDAVTFVMSALFLTFLVYKPSDASKEQGRNVGAVLRQYVEGLRYLREHSDILAIALHKGAFALIVSGGYEVVQVGVAENIFVMGESGGTSLGIMYAVVGIGTGIGPIFARYITGDRERYLRIALILSYIISALGMVLIAPLDNFGVTLVGIVLRGIGGGIGWVFSTQLLLQLVPDEVRGRVFSTEFAIFTLLTAAGATLGGLAVDNAIGYSTIFWWMAGLILIPALLWGLWINTGTRKSTQQN